MADDYRPPKRAKISRDELEHMSKVELQQRIQEQEAQIDSLHNKLEASSMELEKARLPQLEATRRENVLVMRLTTKEQELQDMLNQITELKTAQNPSTTQLRSMLLEPAVNLMFQRMKKEIDTLKEKLEQAQSDLAAWKFTPDSQTGKRLMAKCRMLLQENEELGKTMSAGRIAKLEGEVALSKALTTEMKKSQAEYDEFLVELDEDMEGMHSTIYLLQEQLKETKQSLEQQKQLNQQLQQQLQPQDSLPQSSNAQPPPSEAKSAETSPTKAAVKLEPGD